MLREALDLLTDESDCSKHPALLQELQYDNTIQLIESVRPIHTYTCFMHALGLIDQEQYVSVTRSGSGEIFANFEFVTYLLEQGALVEKTNAEPHDTAIYFQDNTPTHAGIVANNQQLISKWGTGHLYMHAVFEVPAKYGDTIRYYRSLPNEEVLRHFLEYDK